MHQYFFFSCALCSQESRYKKFLFISTQLPAQPSQPVCVCLLSACSRALEAFKMNAFLLWPLLKQYCSTISKSHVCSQYNCMASFSLCFLQFILVVIVYWTSRVKTVLVLIVVQSSQLIQFQFFIFRWFFIFHYFKWYRSDYLSVYTTVLFAKY